MRNIEECERWRLKELKLERRAGQDGSSSRRKRRSEFNKDRARTLLGEKARLENFLAVDENPYLGSVFAASGFHAFRKEVVNGTKMHQSTLDWALVEVIPTRRPRKVKVRPITRLDQHVSNSQDV